LKKNSIFEMNNHLIHPVLSSSHGS
jgi:hypothetical protein